MTERQAAHFAKLRRMREIIQTHLKPGDKVARREGREDTFLGLFEHEHGSFPRYGWYGKFQFQEKRGHLTTARVEMTTILAYIGYDWNTLLPRSAAAVGG